MIAKNILITGGAKRVGAYCVRYLHAQGYNILLHYRSSAQAAKALANELNRQRPDSVRLYQANLHEVTELQALAPVLKSRQGCVVNIVDIHAERGLVGFPVYSVAKAGLVALTKILAKELAPEIRVNAVAPGAILWPEQDDMSAQQKQEIQAKVALQRTGCPEDIAKAIYFLINDAGYITGQVITVDGGRTLFT